MPITSGLAIGLRVKFCNSTPAVASIRPVAIADNVRGRRKFLIKLASVCHPKLPIASGETPNTPTVKSSNNPTATAQKPPPKYRRLPTNRLGLCSAIMGCLLCRMINQIINPAPNIPVTDPTGSVILSNGLNQGDSSITTLLVSHNSIAPKANPAIKRCPIGRIATTLTTLAAAKPTKLKTPTRLTTLAVTTATRVTTSIRTAATGTPKALAWRSSRLMMVKGLTKNNKITGRTRLISTKNWLFCQLVWVKLPLSHAMTPITLSEKKIINSEEIAENKILTTKPPKMSTTGFIRLLAAIANTKPILSNAPTNATQKLPYKPKLGKNSVTINKANCAPVPTASVLSEARVFLTNCCSKTLTTPSNPPANIATNIVGKICNCATICAKVSDCERANSNPNASCQVVLTTKAVVIKTSDNKPLKSQKAGALKGLVIRWLCCSLVLLTIRLAP